MRRNARLNRRRITKPAARAFVLTQPGAICVVSVEMTFEVSMNPEVGEQIGFRRWVMIPDANAALPRTLGVGRSGF
jgi:hypothetical protein